MRYAKWFFSALVVTMMCLLATTSVAEEKLKVLIVTGFDVDAHKWKDSTTLTAAILEKTGRFDVKISESLDAFEAPALNDYDVVVLNYGFWQHPDPSDKGKAGLLNYVKSGKGLVALHFACSSFQEWAEYGELLGRVWKKGVGGHGPFGKFTVTIKDEQHPITAGLKDFETEDELYAKLSGDEKIDIIASAFSDWSGKEEPIVFVKPYGKGRVVQNVLGHGVSARENKSYQELLIRGVEWAATGKATKE